MRKIYSDVNHSLFNLSKTRPEKEVCWSSSQIKHVNLCSFDRFGKYCAVFKLDCVIDILSSKTLLVPIASLTLPFTLDGTDKKDCICHALVWSNDSKCLVGSFSLNSKKRKFSTDSIHYMVIWDVTKLVVSHFLR